MTARVAVMATCLLLAGCAVETSVSPILTLASLHHWQLGPIPLLKLHF